MADRYDDYEQRRFEQRYRPEYGRGAGRGRDYDDEPDRSARRSSRSADRELRGETSYGYGPGYDVELMQPLMDWTSRTTSSRRGSEYERERYGGSGELTRRGGGYDREEQYFDRDSDIPGAAPRGRAEYGLDRPNLGSARSDYGDRAYGGELDKRGLGRRHERHERGFFERAADEVASWVGDREATQRRRMDELREQRRAGDYGRESYYDTYGEGRQSQGSSLYGERTRDYGEGWRSAGSYAGRGPKGYRRSDERIREDVCERLTENWEIDASEIEVNVNNGEVTLMGTVNQRQAKHLAEDIAESVSGVKDVHNQLRVSRPLEIETPERQTNISQQTSEGRQNQPRGRTAAG